MDEVARHNRERWDALVRAGISFSRPRLDLDTESTLANDLVERGFRLRGIWEDAGDAPSPEPGTWPHFKSIAPPWLTFWWELERRP